MTEDRACAAGSTAFAAWLDVAGALPVVAAATGASLAVGAVAAGGALVLMAAAAAASSGVEGISLKYFNPAPSLDVTELILTDPFFLTRIEWLTCSARNRMTKEAEVARMEVTGELE